jgi:hypothetical protein
MFEKLDHPLVFSFVITLLVIFWMAILGWAFSSLGWTGPLGLVKGGTVETQGMVVP